jgi:hypothetical protein
MHQLRNDLNEKAFCAWRSCDSITCVALPAFDQDHRLRLLASLREYVQRAHPPPPDDQLLALTHYLVLARSLGEKAGGEGGAEAFARLPPEAANIEVAILRGLDESDAKTAIIAALGFGEFARFTGLGTTAALEQRSSVGSNPICHALRQPNCSTGKPTPYSLCPCLILAFTCCYFATLCG